MTPSWRLVALILPLCLDTFAVSAALGAARPTRRQRIQISLLFPVAETAMPVLGLVAGAGTARAIGAAAGYVAAAVLIAAGAFLLAEEASDETRRLARTGGWAIVGLTFGIAVDELALGAGIGLLHVSFLAAVIMIAVQAVIASQLGLLLGARVGARLRNGAERAAGLALVTIGIFLFFERLSA